MPLRVAVFSTQSHDRRFLPEADPAGEVHFEWHEARLRLQTAPLARGADAVCLFVHDVADAPTLRLLSDLGVRLLVLRCAGFNNIDLPTAADLGLTVARVPAYSPYAVAEHTVGLMLALNRKFHRAHDRVREGNLTLGGLLGFDMHGKTAGIVGTGKIGEVVARILAGFGCTLLGHDPRPSDACRALGMAYTDLDDLWGRADLISLHCPLTPDNHHLVDTRAFEGMKDGVMLINTSRGGLLDPRAAIAALKSGRLGSLGLDVYEEEADLFYEDFSDRVIQDDVFARLCTFPNVLITAHQAFYTREALANIAETTLANITGYTKDGIPKENLVSASRVKPRG